MDLAGNRLYDSVLPYTVKSIKPEKVSIEEAQLIAKNKIRLVFSVKMKSINASDIELTNLTTPSAIRIVGCESTTTNSDGKTKAVLLLDEELATDVTDMLGSKIDITTTQAPSSESEWGTKLKAQPILHLEDKTAPEIF